MNIRPKPPKAHQIKDYTEADNCSDKVWSLF